MAPTVDDRIDLKRRNALGPLGYADQCPTRVHFCDDPIAVIRLVPKQGIEVHAFYERRHADRIVAVSRQQDKAHQVAKRICEREDLGGPATF